MTQEDLLDSVTRDIGRNLFEEREKNIPTLTWKSEQKLMSAIRSGNIESVRKELNNPDVTESAHPEPGFYSDDSMRQSLYLFIAGVVLFTRASISGGVPDDYASAMLRTYIQHADQAVNEEQISRLYADAVQRYTLTVHDYRMRYTNSHDKVEQIKEYISSHLHEHLSVQDIAAAVFLNPSYCCQIFRKETGITINTFIQQERLRASVNLLKYSDYSVEQISNYLGFGSQSYFTQLFRRQYGITPGQYRKENKPDEFVI